MSISSPCPLASAWRHRSYSTPCSLAIAEPREDLRKVVRRQLEQPPPARGTASLLHQHPSVPVEPQVPAQMLQHPLHAHKKKRGALHQFLLEVRAKQCVTDGVSICEKVGTIFRAGWELVGLGRIAPIRLSVSLKSFIAGKGVVL